ncbi:hypothetical protein Tco_0264826 [Tanacetum coccineum]
MLRDTGIVETKFSSWCSERIADGTSQCFWGSGCRNVPSDRCGPGTVYSVPHRTSVVSDYLFNPEADNASLPMLPLDLREKSSRELDISNGHLSELFSLVLVSFDTLKKLATRWG